MDERMEKIVALWNNAPYPSLLAIGKAFGVTRQRVEQILTEARTNGHAVLDVPARAVLRFTARIEAKTAGRPRCCVCKKLLTKNAPSDAEGRYYCTIHRYSPNSSYADRHNGYQRQYGKALRRAARVKVLKQAIIGEILDRRLPVDPQEFVASLFHRLAEMPLHDGGE